MVRVFYPRFFISFNDFTHGVFKIYFGFGYSVAFANDGGLILG